MGFCLSYRLPSILLKLRCPTPRRIYSLAWSLSDAHGCFVLDATRFEMPKRTIQHWLKYFVKWHLIEVIEAGGGRGRRAVFKIKGKTEYLRQQTKTKLCKEASIKSKEIKAFTANASDKNPKAWLLDRQKRWTLSFRGWDKFVKGKYGYDQLAQCLRYNLWDLGLGKTANEKITGLILNALEDQSCDNCKDLCGRLLRFLADHRVRLLKFAGKLRRVCSWVGWLIAKLKAGLGLRKTHSMELGAHRESCECHECDRQRVARQRAEAKRAYRGSLRGHADEQCTPIRQLTLQDIAQRFGLMPSQVTSIVKNL